MRSQSEFPRLIAITSIELATEDEHLTAYRRLGGMLPFGSMWIQLRDRRSVREMMAFGRALRTLGFPLIVNDRLDVAKALGACGAHLGRLSVNADHARAFLGAEAFLTRSFHHEDRLDEPIDAALVSPIFASPGKDAAVGIAAITSFRSAYPGVPIVALGGVDGSNARACFDAGASGIAVIRAALDLSAHESLANALA